MQISNSKLVYGADCNSIASDGAFGKIKLILRRRMKSDSFGLSLSPSKDHEEYKCEEGGVEEHDISKYNILRIVSSSISDGGMRIGWLFTFGHGHVVRIEGGEYHGWDHQEQGWVKA